MLPMFDKKKMVGAVIARRGKQDIHTNTEVEAPGSNEGLKSACEDILGAIESKSPMDLAKAMRAAFDILDSEEDEEPSESE